MLFQAPRGTHDILPGEVEKWQSAEGIFRELCALYGYSEIRTPMFERTDLFKRSSGESSDIVRKQMYTFTPPHSAPSHPKGGGDPKDDSQGSAEGDELTLRPEGTAPVVRAYLENALYASQPVTKLYYIAPIFRYERPQAGRYRQHHQMGVELFGVAAPEADAEVIILGWELLRRMGVADADLHLNSIGCPDCRPRLREVLRETLKPVLPELCDDCKVRYELNAMRILDCKVERCGELTRDAPRMLDYLCEGCRVHFARLQEILQFELLDSDTGDLVSVNFKLDPRLVRGLDYYTRTAFEFTHGALGAKDTVIGGGRYDGLIELLGGKPTPGVGFGCGIERLLLASAKEWGHSSKSTDVFVAPLGEKARDMALRLLYELRAGGMHAEIDYLGRSLKSQLREADRQGATVAIIIGENELARNVATIRNLKTSEQSECAIDEVRATTRDLLATNTTERGIVAEAREAYSIARTERESEPFPEQNPKLGAWEIWTASERGQFAETAHQRNQDWIEREMARHSAKWIIVMDGKVTATGSSASDYPSSEEIEAICRQTGKYPFIFVSRDFVQIEEGLPWSPIGREDW